MVFPFTKTKEGIPQRRLEYKPNVPGWWRVGRVERETCRSLNALLPKRQCDSGATDSYANEVGAAVGCGCGTRRAGDPEARGTPSRPRGLHERSLLFGRVQSLKKFGGEVFKGWTGRRFQNPIGCRDRRGMRPRGCHRRRVDESWRSGLARRAARDAGAGLAGSVPASRADGVAACHRGC